MRFAGENLMAPQPIQSTSVAAVPPAVGIQMIRDFLKQKTAPGTLQDAYLNGAPGVEKPDIPDTVRPADSDDQFMDVMRSGFV